MSKAAVDHYKALNVPRDATRKEIQRAFRALSRANHPDSSNPSKDRSIFDAAAMAWEVLGDEAKRSSYDAELRLAERRAAEAAADRPRPASAEADPRVTAHIRDLFAHHGPTAAGLSPDEIAALMAELSRQASPFPQKASRRRSTIWSPALLESLVGITGILGWWILRETGLLQSLVDSPYPRVTDVASDADFAVISMLCVVAVAASYWFGSTRALQVRHPVLVAAFCGLASGLIMSGEYWATAACAVLALSGASGAVAGFYAWRPVRTLLQRFAGALLDKSSLASRKVMSQIVAMPKRVAQRLRRRN